LADGELARYEPELSRVERRVLHLFRDRTRALLRQRANVDRLLFRSQWLVRRVVLDIDRRLKRIDGAVPDAGAFHCSETRLKNALRSGRPELTRVIHMRQVERLQQSHEPAPPLSFTGSPPRGGVPLMLTPTLEGVGVSSGVVEGRARVVRGRLPHAIEQGEVLVVTMLDPALSPVCALAAGVVSEVGGALSLGAELARDLALPAVVGVPDAALHIRDGEMLRVDGGRGTVQRLEPM
jgi:pyruvate,water dikinase